jgi:hypothetical protein
MKRLRRVAAVLFVLTAFGVALAPSAGATTCAPGQHGNPHPGFKPGSC